MIRLNVSEKTGRPTLVVGITKRNIEEMQKGRPLYVDPNSVEVLGLPRIEIVVFTSDTQHQLIDQLLEDLMITADQAAALHHETEILEAQHGSST